MDSNPSGRGNSRNTGDGDVPALSVENLSAWYNHKLVLKGVTFSVERGAMVGVVGPNGAGKSTLFKAILGLHKGWRGTINVFDGEAGSNKRLMGYTPQIELVDWDFPLRVFDVVLMGRYGKLGLFRRPGGEDRDIVWRSLEQVGLEGLAMRQIGELSGGQRRRALIARALAQEPEVLLLDEPVAGLDATAQHDLTSLLQELTDRGKTILVATHDLSCVATSFQQALCLNESVIAYGPPRTILTEEVLNATFKSHLLLLNVEGRIYAAHKDKGA